MSNKKKDKKETEIQKAVKLIQIANQRKINECNKEITVVLNKYGMQLKVVSNIALVPKNK